MIYNSTNSSYVIQLPFNPQDVGNANPPQPLHYSHPNTFIPELFLISGIIAIVLTFYFSPELRNGVKRLFQTALYKAT